MLLEKKGTKNYVKQYMYPNCPVNKLLMLSPLLYFSLTSQERSGKSVSVSNHQTHWPGHRRQASNRLPPMPPPGGRHLHGWRGQFLRRHTVRQKQPTTLLALIVNVGARVPSFFDRLLKFSPPSIEFFFSFLMLLLIDCFTQTHHSCLCSKSHIVLTSFEWVIVNISLHIF